MEDTIIKIQDIDFYWETENPFIFCVHHNDQFPKGNEHQEVDAPLYGRNLGNDFSRKQGFSMYHGTTVPGFPAHPHRGFETVTIVLKGFIDHHDSYGAQGRYGNGDVQWLTTGKGCMHSEMFPLVNIERDNPCELFQIWLNLPAKDKFAEPHFKMLWAEDIPKITISDSNNKKISVNIISGEFNNVKSLASPPSSWASDPNNKVGIFLIDMEPDSSITLPKISNTLIRNLYFYSGDDVVIIDNNQINSNKRIKLQGDKEVTIRNGNRQSLLLLLEAEPINENVVQYGPFVMNTEEEIRKAYSDYRETGFGGWKWDRHDPVNERESGRFAKLSDGRTEQR